MSEYNRYYHHFLNQRGRGQLTIPEIGEIYHYKTALRRGEGHLFNARIRDRNGLGFSPVLSSILQRGKPLFQVLGTKAVNVISNIAKDTISGKKFKDAVIKNIHKALPPGVAQFIPPNLGDSSVVNSPVSPNDIIKTQSVKRL
jgi:hypothetical protein